MKFLKKNPRYQLVSYTKSSEYMRWEVLIMKKNIIITVLIAIMLFTSTVFAAGSITITSEYLKDDTGYNYGTNFFVDSSVNEQIYVNAYIKSQNNVIGAVVSGNFLLQPNEKHFKIGTFMQSDKSKAWNVNVGATWQKA